jgi:hypothetical protein
MITKYSMNKSETGSGRNLINNGSFEVMFLTFVYDGRNVINHVSYNDKCRIVDSFCLQRCTQAHNEKQKQFFDLIKIGVYRENGGVMTVSTHPSQFLDNVQQVFFRFQFNKSSTVVYYLRWSLIFHFFKKNSFINTLDQVDVSRNQIILAYYVRHDNLQTCHPYRHASLDNQ